MIHRKGSMSWILVWGCTLLLTISILSIGYLNVLSAIPKEKQQVTEQKRLIPPEKKTTAAQTGLENGLKPEAKTQGLEAAKEASLSYQDFPCPVRGKLLKGVGNYYFETIESYMFHPGQDYSEPEGTVIRATHDGKVVFAGPDPFLGQKIILDCGQGWTVTYGGLDNLWVKAGQTVKRQELLGQVGYYPGSDGINGQPQLHYEVWYDNKVQKPNQT
jgi:murein DD-endopeptidase MepM/ murein hydrolase activator NlpD